MKSRLILILVGLTLLSATGCADSGSSDDGRVRVAASFYPLAQAAREVGGDLVDVTDLTPPGVEPHDLELTPRRLNAILDADLVVVMGKRFQPSVDDAAKHNDHRIEVLDALHVDGDDPHVWLDPVAMGEIVGLVADGLAKADPDNATVYQSRARSYRARLAELDDDLRAGLDDCRRTDLVTAHASFGWLAKRYGLTQDAIVGITPDAEPDARRIDDLADLVKEKGVTTVFTESLLSPKVAKLLAREADVKTAVLNPLEGLTEQQIERGATYTSVMRDNLATMRAALGCP